MRGSPSWVTWDSPPKASPRSHELRGVEHHRARQSFRPTRLGHTIAARAIEEAGAFAVLLEALPPEAGALVREGLTIPVYGIGAGPHVDGQLVISHDILGNFVGTVTPRFASRYASLDVEIERAFRSYATDVRTGAFPRPEHCYQTKDWE